MIDFLFFSDYYYLNFNLYYNYKTEIHDDIRRYKENANGYNNQGCAYDCHGSRWN